MGYIKEPKGVDLIVEPSMFTEQDKKIISEIIANYKLTGKKPRNFNLPHARKRIRKEKKNTVVKS